MTVIVYTASRELVSGHTSGTEYMLSFESTEVTPKYKAHKKVITSMAGSVESTLDRIDEDWRIRTTDLIADTFFDEFIEFLNSTLNSETYTLSPYGTKHSATSVTFADNGASADTITRADGGSFVTDGVTAGQTIRITGANASNSSFTVGSLTATVITLDAADAVTAESGTSIDFIAAAAADLKSCYTIGDNFAPSRQGTSKYHSFSFTSRAAK